MSAAARGAANHTLASTNSIMNNDECESKHQLRVLNTAAFWRHYRYRQYARLYKLLWLQLHSKFFLYHIYNGVFSQVVTPKSAYLLLPTSTPARCR